MLRAGPAACATSAAAAALASLVPDQARSTEGRAPGRQPGRRAAAGHGVSLIDNSQMALDFLIAMLVVCSRS